MNKVKVGVFIGGRNTEKEVSFNSGRTICDHLDTERFTVIPIFQTFAGKIYILPYRFLHRGKTSDFEHRLPKEGKEIKWDDLKTLVDFIYLAVHGRNCEDGTLQGMLEVLGIPYLGSNVFTSSLCMDKILQRNYLQMHNINVPKGIAIYPSELKNKDLITKKINNAKLQLPFIVKPHKEGSSLGVEVIKNIEELLPALQKSAHIHPNEIQPVLVEEKVMGMEFSCIIIEDINTKKSIALPPTEIVVEKKNACFDYEQKYMPGRATKHTPARCSNENLKKIQDVCVQTKEVLGISTIARVDGFLTPQGDIYIIDPNTLSGMSPTTFLFLQAAEVGMSHTDLINHLIDTDLKQLGITTRTGSKEKKSMTKKTKVAVLLGGNSNEREISLESGRNVFYKLSPNKYDATALFVSSKMELYQISQRLLVRNSTAEIESELDPKTKILWNDLPQIADFVFIGLHGGAGENGSVQGTLDTLGLPHNGSSVFASALCMDKYKTNQVLAQQGFDVPASMLINKDFWESKQTEVLDNIIQKIGLPTIIKPHDDGCSVMVYKAKGKDELIQSINAIFAQNKKHALIEELVTGMELTIGVVGNDKPAVLPPSQAVTNKGVLSMEEKFLPGAGENQTPAPLPQSALKFVQNQMEKVFTAAQCTGYARIDCFYQSANQSPSKKERVVTIEINTLPAMTPATCLFHQAAEVGIKPMEFIDKIISLGFEKHLQYKVEKVKEKSLEQSK